jgi:type II secretory pathway pseudopilin PulG
METKNKRVLTGFTPLEKKPHPLGIIKKRGDGLKPRPIFLTGFTLAELLTAVAIIALLIGLLLPALTYVRNTAKGTMQKAQINTIELALTTFRNDYGDYPPSDNYSHYITPIQRDYCGAQKLAEALLGWDLLGFHPKSAWRADGYDESGGAGTYDPQKTREVDGDGVLDTLNERKGPYLELANANAFRLGISPLGDGLFVSTTHEGETLAPYAYVLCDVFAVKKITLANGTTVKAGTPILYYKANTSSKQISDGIPDPAKYPDYIYNYYDNGLLLDLGKVKDGTEHKLGTGDYFYSTDGGVFDPKVTTATFAWPYRPDSYILISAGADGEYGTADDVTNFK